VNYDNSLVVNITVTCYSWAPSSGDHLFACGAIYRPPQFPTEKRTDNSIHVNFVNLLRMIKKQFEQTSRGLLALVVELIKLL